jgi:hypothetical protein
MQFLFLFFLFCLDMGSCYVVQVGLELKMLLSQPSNRWDYSNVP